MDSGVVMGGAERVGGVVEQPLEGHAGLLREVRGMKQAELIETAVAAVEELRSSVPDVDAVGFGIPCLIDQTTGIAVIAVNLDIQDFPFREVMRERLGLPVFIDNDGNVTT